MCNRVSGVATQAFPPPPPHFSLTPHSAKNRRCSRLICQSSLACMYSTVVQPSSSRYSTCSNNWGRQLFFFKKKKKIKESTSSVTLSVKHKSSKLSVSHTQGRGKNKRTGWWFGGPITLGTNNGQRVLGGGGGGGGGREKKGRGGPSLPPPWWGSFLSSWWRLIWGKHASDGLNTKRFFFFFVVHTIVCNR